MPSLWKKKIGFHKVLLAELCHSAHSAKKNGNCWQLPLRGWAEPVRTPGYLQEKQCSGNFWRPVAAGKSPSQAAAGIEQ
jgi:hypothetical protein